MNKILLARIDSRLNHGRVVSDRTKESDTDTVIIANERVANDKFWQNLMDLTIPEEIESIYIKTNQVKKYLEENENKKIFLIVEDAKDLKEIIDQDVEVEKVNIGIIHLSRGKKLLTEEVAVDSKDLEIFQDLIQKGSQVFIQLNPFSVRKDLSEFLQKNK